MKPEKLIGRKVKGFKFEENYYVARNMDSYIDKIGTIEAFIYNNERVVVDFSNSNSWIYPADQIEAHLVEDEIPIKEQIKNNIKIKYLLKIKDTLCDKIEIHTLNEIPTLSDGVMMLVSDTKVVWYKQKVIGQKEGIYYVWSDRYIRLYKYAKPLEPTKEDQLTAILGSSEKVSEIMELFKNE